MKHLNVAWRGKGEKTGLLDFGVFNLSHMKNSSSDFTVYREASASFELFLKSEICQN